MCAARKCNKNSIHPSVPSLECALGRWGVGVFYLDGRTAWPQSLSNARRNICESNIPRPNKSQGQSIKHVGIDLQSKHCFAHGQFYAGLMRATRRYILHLIVPTTDEARKYRHTSRSSLRVVMETVD